MKVVDTERRHKQRKHMQIVCVCLCMSWNTLLQRNLGGMVAVLFFQSCLHQVFVSKSYSFCESSYQNIGFKLVSLWAQLEVWLLSKSWYLVDASCQINVLIPRIQSFRFQRNPRRTEQRKWQVLLCKGHGLAMSRLSLQRTWPKQHYSIFVMSAI